MSKAYPALPQSPYGDSSLREGARIDANPLAPSQRELSAKQTEGERQAHFFCTNLPANSPRV